ncbi:DUF4148 domain-containing protein [Paraburkholderia sp. LEh10]|uniref:DUF4148 domain-containing protein n=1 Tax=Paraburkholderia sp. LEh10 TaxID=2821353 RepID=UPI001AE19A28|nr:DUF4148 domain-containing protein [Paraburkholderia sp. LEh10]MBP0590045.1 DUF4148 domain-containing protein [Paraburkholderia sp. LEh10]
MNRVYQALVIAAALGLPLAGHAQTSPSGSTRAQLHAELIAAEQSGQYAQSDTSYPESANHPAVAPHVFHYSHDTVAGSYGPSTNGSLASGFRATRARSLASGSLASDDIYRGH